jgi:hypothetical protein
VTGLELGGVLGEENVVGEDLAVGGPAIKRPSPLDDSKGTYDQSCY